jgi:hypothetical protein
MGNVVAIEQEKPAKKSAAQRYSHFSEDPRAQFLLVGTDEFGTQVFYFQISIIGFHRRIFDPIASARRRSGPYVMPQSAMNGFCNMEN